MSRADTHGPGCECIPCVAHRPDPVYFCQCGDCLAHRDPSEYGDLARMAALVTELREALVGVLEVVADPKHIEHDDDGDGVRAWLEIPRGVHSRAFAALEKSRAFVI